MFGVCSMVAPLRRVAVRAPGPALLNADPAVWHYGPGFDPGKIKAEHAAFTALLAAHGSDVLHMNGGDRGIADAVFTYDASLMTPAGAVLMRPGKTLRAGEQDLHRTFYGHQDIPIVGEIGVGAHIEAGDTLWLDERTLAVGRGFRTDRAGIERLTALLAAQDITVHAFDLPLYHGAEACLHLMSLISLLDDRTALTRTPLLPVGLWRLLRDMGFILIDAPGDEFERSGTLSLNVLATAPGRCIAVDGNPKTRAAMEATGVEVSVFSGQALCVACEGGPTCLTRPLLRG